MKLEDSMFVFVLMKILQHRCKIVLFSPDFNTMRKIILFPVLGLIIMLACSWGFLGHRTINQIAVYQLPQELRPFFYSEMQYLVSNAPRPDTRRNKDESEATKHFIDFEMFGKNAAYNMPFDYKKAVARYSEDSLLKYGYVPYVIMEVQDRLTNAFKTGNKDSILFYAADLGHYVADAHVPLHTTVNYDGQLTNQKGMHSLWESMIPELTISEFNLYSNYTATYLKKPEQKVWAALRNAYKLVPVVLETEKTVSLQFTDSTKYRRQMRRGKEVKTYSTAFARACAKEMLPAINEQLVKASNLVADFWFTAWVNAGKPELNKIFKINAEDASKLNKELESYKNNQLIDDDLLMSKQKKSVQPQDAD